MELTAAGNRPFSGVLPGSTGAGGRVDFVAGAEDLAVCTEPKGMGHTNASIPNSFNFLQILSGGTKILLPTSTWM